MGKINVFSFVILAVSSIVAVADGVIQDYNDCHFDVGFVLDVSGSMKYFDKRQRTFLKLMTKELNISANGNRASLVHFSTHAQHDIKLKDHQSAESFNRALDNIPLLERYTRIDIALKIAHKEIFLEQNGGRADLPKLLILMTDGNQTQMPGAVDPIRIAQNIRKTGVRVIVIGTGVVETSKLARLANGEEWHNITALRKKEGKLFAAKVKELMCPICADNFDIGFVLDSSGSLRYHYHSEKEFIARIAEAFRISKNGTKAGVITFSTTAEVSINLKDHDNVDTFKRALDKIPLMNGFTRIDHALRLADTAFFRTKNGAREEMPKVLIVLTDGSQTQASDMLNPVHIAEHIREQGVKMVVIGVGRSINKTELIEISGDQKNTYDVKSFEELTGKSFVDQMKKATCRLGKYSNFNLKHKGSEYKEGQIVSSKVKLIATKPPSPVKYIQCDGLFDIGIIMDVSGRTITPQQFSDVQSFIKQLSSAFEISRRGNHLGLISTYDIATVNIRLNQYFSARSFSTAIDGLKHYKGESRVDDMLQIADESFFQRKYGERNYAQDVLILVTDGIENFSDMYNSIRGASKIRQRGVHLVIVGVGRNIDQKLRVLVPDGRENLIRAESYKGLVNVMTKLHENACSIKSQCVDYYLSKCEMLARYCIARSQTMQRFMKAACCKTCNQSKKR